MKVRIEYTTTVSKEIEVDDRYQGAVKSDAEIAEMSAEQYAEWDNLTDELYDECYRVIGDNVGCVYTEDGQVIMEF